ncbi:MAG: O-antigen ligase family protein [Thermoflexales bacterium]|nr:O-antigen ligase family protein [Thermoflexales bacterium]
MSESKQKIVPTEPRWRRAARRLVWLEPVWVMAIGVLLLLPQRFLPTSVQQQVEVWRASAVILPVMGGLLRWLAYGRLTRRTPLDWPLLLMLIWLPVNYWASVDKAASWEALSPLIVGVALFWALLNWPPALRHPQLIGWSIVVMGVGLAFTAPLFSDLAIGKLFRISALETLQQKLSASLPGNVNANQIAGVLAVVAPLAAALTLRRDWRTHRRATIAAGLATMFILAMLALTQSRGAYLAAAIAIGVVAVLRWRKLVYVVPFLLVAAIIMVAVLGPLTVLNAALSGGAISGLDGRLEIWSRALYAINDFPFTGIGIGTWNTVIPTLYPLFSIAPDTKLDHAHNLLLQVGLDVGLPGFIAYVALYLTTFGLLIKALRQQIAALDVALAAGAVAALSAMFIHGIVDVPLWDSKPAFLPWLIIALAILLGLRTLTPQPD